MTLELFPNISLSARLFIYTANQTLNSTESSEFSKSLMLFLDNWKAHGSSLEASFMLIANRVLLIVVDEKDQTATGCSIDSLNRHLQSSDFDWFSRNWVLHTSEAPSIKGDWDVSDLQGFQEKCRNGDISKNEYVLNTAVLSVQELHENLIQKVSDSWHYRML